MFSSSLHNKFRGAIRYRTVTSCNALPIKNIGTCLYSVQVQQLDALMLKTDDTLGRYYYYIQISIVLP
jgi:hypothetical protein